MTFEAALECVISQIRSLKVRYWGPKIKNIKTRVFDENNDISKVDHEVHDIRTLKAKSCVS